MKTAIGLTGGIGSGKSLVAKVFEHLGIGVFYSDLQAKSLYNNPVFLQEIASEFGSDILKGGIFQPKRLAEIVFADKTKLKRLNAMVHPRVFELFERWKSSQGSPYVLMESAILFENRLERHFARIITINTPIDVVIRRVMERDCCSKDEVLQRLSNQMPQEQKNALADFVILHDGRSMLLPQILEIHSQILKSLN